jgi:hypothetical protein
MINRLSLLSDLQKLLTRLEADLLERSECTDIPEVGRTLRAEFERAHKAKRTAQNYEAWRTDAITQAAAAWVLSCVFVRFLEDNRLIDPPRISGQQSAVSDQGGNSAESRPLTTESFSRLQRARDEHELYFRAHPTQTDREYLLSIFDELARLPGTRDVFGQHNPIRELQNWLSGDAAGELLKFFQKIDANTGALIHDFTDPHWDTRFLGDLYQDLSEAARKKYALLQTPDFVEQFILDRTLDPALDEFGLEPIEPRPSGSGDAASLPDGRGSANIFKMIDPACGSGHFLLGSFPRILDRWMKKEPGGNVRELVQRTLDSIHGVDVNPFAIAIARFRLLLAALRACGIQRLADAPAFEMNLVCGDSLLHVPLKSGGKKFTRGQLEFDAMVTTSETGDDESHAYQSEDLRELKRIVRPGQYHAVVANPPYITPKDRALNDQYRNRFESCHMKYSLSVPFMEQLFRLATESGFTGQITSNSFMKREFGKKLIESFFPNVDLTHVIDTAGAYIPGHGTPTVIMFGRHRVPVSSTLRTVMGIRGEPSTPEDPAQGLVWLATVSQVDQPGSHSQFVSSGDSPRELFHKHPWSIGGGGAAELKERLHEGAMVTLSLVADEIGILGMTNADEVMLAPRVGFVRKGVEPFVVRRLTLGDEVRDWSINDGDYSLFPYRDGQLMNLTEMQGLGRWLWPSRTVLGNRATFGRLTYFQEGRPWWEWHQVALNRLRTPLSIVFAFVATHNHFVLDRGGKAFKHSAPIIKLPATATLEDHIGLLGLLNSSVVGFLMRQFGHNMGDSTDDAGARTTGDSAFNTFQFNSTQVANLPLPTQRPIRRPRLLDDLVQIRRDVLPSVILQSVIPTGSELAAANSAAQIARSQMIAAQEELDWECYRLYGLIADDLTIPETPPLKLGQRAFEIVLARKMAAGETQTTWFERHGSTPITELPADWPDDYRQLVERRIALIESDPNIRLIEQPEYKRRWNTEPWESQLERALRDWLLNRLEGYFDFDGRMREPQGASRGSSEAESQPAASAVPLTPLAEIQLVSIARLATIVGQDGDFLQVGELYRNDPAFDVQALVTELVTPECVPLLPILRYKPSGLIKRSTWERTWDLQRQEDEYSRQLAVVSGLLENADDPAEKARLKAELERLTAESQKLTASIAVPTKYDSKDFVTSDFWRLRGKLDVPKERWISLPHCDGPDGTLMLCWAGYNHLQQARAISAYYVQVQTEFGGTADPRLIPLLACLIELLPWLKQWHSNLDAEFGVSMADYFEGFVNEEARQLGKTLQEVRDWTPPAKTAARGRRRASI